LEIIYFQLKSIVWLLIQILFKMLDGKTKYIFKMRNIFIVATLIIWVMVGCKEGKLEPLYPSGDAPSLIKVSKVEAYPGSVKVTYELPNERDLLYVLAEYRNKYGQIVQNKSSTYINSIT